MGKISFSLLGTLGIVSIIFGATFIQLEPGQYSKLYPAKSDTVLYEDFDEIGVGELPVGWDTVDITGLGVSAHWHVSHYQAIYGDSTWWCGSEGEPGWTNPPGYGNLWRQYLTLSLDLTSVSAPCSLKMVHRYDAEYEGPESPFECWDGMNVRLSSDDGTTWEIIHPVGGYPRSAVYAFYLQDGDTLPGYSGPLHNWGVARYDISDYVGNLVKIRFHFASDMYCSDEDFPAVDFDGAWFIDNILVGTSVDTIFFDDVEMGAKPEWEAEGYPAFITGNFWMIIDSLHHPQPDGRSIYFSYPNAAFCGDTASSVGDGTYTPADHEDHGLSNAIITPTIDLSAFSTATLEFMERNKGDGNGGYGFVDYSIDGGETWTEIDGRSFDAPTNWHPYSIIIPEQALQPEVKFRFRGGSGTSGAHYVYWYIDNVLVTGSGTEALLQNDDGSSAYYWGDMGPGYIGASKLTPTFYPCKLKRILVEFYTPLGTGSGTYAIHIYEAPGEGLPGDDITPPETIGVEITTHSHWEITDFASRDIKFEQSEVFWVGVEQISTPDSVLLLTDEFQEVPNVNAMYTEGEWQNSLMTGDFMIRAVIDTTTLGIEEIQSGEFTLKLWHPTPNPATDLATIYFSLSKSGKVSLRVYNVSGQLIRVLLDKVMGQGIKSIVWDGRDDCGRVVGSGVYFYELKSCSRTATEKLILMRR